MLGHVLDITAALDRDQDRPLGARHQRDREIALAQELLPLPSGSRDRVAIVDAWWQTVQSRAEDFAAGVQVQVDGHALDRARTAGAILLFVAGCALGCGVTAAALHYDGSFPVNLVSVLGVLVAIPAFLLLMTLALLPGRIRGFGWLQDVLATFSPGQWLSAWMNRRFASADLGWRGRMTRTAELTAAAPDGYRTVAKWQLVLYSQWLALGFFAASLVTILLLVTFSDLAFGWSTTLNVANERVIGWVQALVTPWAGWLSSAVPSAELIAQSRFFRAAELTPAQVQGLGAWWPFLMAAVGVYGLLPRLLLAAFAGWRLRVAERDLLLAHPQVQRLLERLATPITVHEVDQPEREDGVASAVLENAARPSVDGGARYQLPSGQVVLVNWNNALSDAQLQSWLAQHSDRVPEQILLLGAQVAIAEQDQLLNTLTADAAVIVTKAWEPPLLEFLDVARALKERVRDGGPVLLLPLGIGGAQAAASDRAIWQQTVAQLDDVRIRLWRSA